MSRFMKIFREETGNSGGVSITTYAAWLEARLDKHEPDTEWLKSAMSQVQTTLFQFHGKMDFSVSVVNEGVNNWAIRVTRHNDRVFTIELANNRITVFGPCTHHPKNVDDLFKVVITFLQGAVQ